MSYSPPKTVLMPFVKYVLISMLLLQAVCKAQSNDTGAISRVENTAFQRGEKLSFQAAYYSRLTGNVVAGEASLEIMSEDYHANPNILHVAAEINTTGLFNLFYRVQNRYDSYIDETTMAPFRFTRDIREGRYRRKDNVIFDDEKMLAFSDRDTITIPPYVRDMLSAIYFARTFSMENVEKGDYFSIDFHMSDSVYVSRIIFEGPEQINIGLGTFKALRFSPKVQEGAIFSQPYPMTVWISDDKNRIPLRIETGLVVGSARLELQSFSGIKHQFNSFVPQ